MEDKTKELPAIRNATPVSFYAHQSVRSIGLEMFPFCPIWQFQPILAKRVPSEISEEIYQFFLRKIVSMLKKSVNALRAKLTDRILAFSTVSIIMPTLHGRGDVPLIASGESAALLNQDRSGLCVMGDCLTFSWAYSTAKKFLTAIQSFPQFQIIVSANRYHKKKP
ncbi:hypothetical protein EZ456_04525 [Pedobacter psychrodurus]|uniref:Uncharacterized protein n=1 Tax=Pedobacter psychrodurus TaxID=2530456 RepID=A0A4V6N6L3_9SPHI|nr:hypothetical protein [Pedobacter psychrodurus]TCD28657.1 hypothetical protein EZ456_04525 [Pedobacter psychrodurus]